MEVWLPDLRTLEERLDGRLFRPHEPGYDSATELFNGMLEFRPAAVARVAGPRDVSRAVLFAREQGLPLAVRGGAHSLPGFSSCDGGLVIDLGELSAVEVDPAERVARVGGGATWGKVNDATHAHGLATPGGVVSTTGVGGLTLGGGIGYLSRQYGLACDNLLAAEVVTADGSIVRCDADERGGLLWALRGGGGNFGVVTRFEFRLHPVGEILAGPTFFVPDADVLAGFRDWLAGAPHELGALFAITRAPGLPFVPEEHHGQPAMGLIVSWTGEPSGLHHVLRPLDSWGTIIGQSVGPMPYPVLNTLFDDLLPFGLRNYWKSLVAYSISDEAVDAHAEQADGVPNVESGVFFHPIDGACHDVDSGATAFPHRAASCVVGFYGTWRHAEDDDENTRWVRRCCDALRAHYADSQYVNFAPNEGPDATRAIYGDNYDRLARVKRAYDPGNLFRRNQNVPPAAA